MRSFDRIACAPLLAAMFGGQPALAETAGVVAEVKQLHIELIDLDATDGITPWIRFKSDKPLTLMAFANPGIWPDGFAFDGASLGGTVTGTATATLPSTIAHAEGSAGDIFLAGLGPTLSASANAMDGTSAWASVSIGGIFTLSPKTRVVLSGEPGTTSIDLRSGSPGSALAFASVEFCPLNAGGETLCFDGTTNLADADFAGEQRSPTFNYSAHPSLITRSWDNISTVEQQRFLSMGVYASVDLMAAVPEPASGVLATFGLGLLVRAVRQRRRQDAAEAVSRRSRSPAAAAA